ncbi:villin-2 [Zea mays]|uniref:Villin-2 n=3 Tax=Zea mays TaxID=4577 RepID=A0A1D6K3K0_MAIZE|nr:villin-2 [Zea mays]ONL98217.1 Villin-2 [Zea mays]ONL98231.1 Villin-2 [Zea mays]|eukprot:XP_008655853.1 villin-2 [Zea mays]
MSTAKVVLEPAFQGAGHKPGTEIWRIEDFKPVALPKSDYGKFYCGDSYIVLQTTCKGGAFIFDIHFWIGKDSSQDEAGTAAIKTVELDSMLGGRAVQHREPQCYESDKFLSYFKPCIIPMEGGFASGFKKPEVDKFETRLYICKGKRAIRVKEVPFSRSSLNHDDVFILDTENKIYQFNGANSNIQERAKALEVIQHLKEEYHDGVCAVAIVDDGKLQAESDSGEFWVLFGGFAPIGKKAISDDDVVLETTSPKLFSISNGQLKLEDAVLTKSILENTKCFLLDCGAELFVWVGRVTQVEDRKAASAAVEKYIIKENRPKTTRITQVIQGYENHTFKSKFESWPVSNTSGSASTEEGRGKVTALLKQKGVDVKGISKTSVPVNDEVPPLLDGGGKLEVWCIDGSAKTALPKEELGKFYSGDCYVVLYTYHSAEKKEEFYLAYWIGKNSVQEDQEAAFQIANTTFNSLKGRPVQGRIYQGKEPPQFVAIFQPMVILKGGTSSGYKKFVEEKGLKDETYCSDGTALIQISGTAVHNNKTLQVDAVATSLSSTDCFVLQAKNSMFIWNGNASSFEQQQWAAKVAEFLKTGVAVKHCKEGTESSIFWSSIGGKQSYTNRNAAPDVVIREPHLYTFSLRNGKLEVTEIFNFSQDDLLTEDMMILDTHCEVFVWMGQCVETKEKQKAFDIGQKYVQHAVAFEGISPDVPLYKVNEGNEPCFFRTYFSWDSARSVIHGNSFEKKLSVLFGMRSEGGNKGSGDGGPTQRASALAALSSALNPSSQGKQSDEKPTSSDDSEHTQRASAMAALSSALNPSTKPSSTQTQSHSGQGSQRAAAVAALSNVLTAEGSHSPRHSRSSPTADADKTELVPTSPHQLETGTAEDVRTEPDVSQEQTAKENGGQTTFSYERLISKSTDPVSGINNKRRETYLVDSEFETVFGMTKEEFYEQPRWKQELQKKKADLF